MDVSILSLARQARSFYPYAAPVQRRRQAARYARSVILLGDKWLLAKRVEKLSSPRPV